MSVLRIAYEMSLQPSTEPTFWVLSLYADGSPNKQDRKSVEPVHLVLKAPRRQVRARDVKHGDIVHLPLQWYPSTVTREVESAEHDAVIGLSVIVIDGHCYRFDNCITMIEVEI